MTGGDGGSPTATATRRRLLSTLGAGATLPAVGTVALAGCTDDTESTSRSDHPAFEATDGTPHLGPPVADAETAIVAFEDPSCDSCARFAVDTLPQLRSEAIDPGRTAYLWRAAPAVEPWGWPASRALFAVHRRDSEGFWTLKGRYYESRSSITAETVVDRTVEFIESGAADVDPAVVVDAMADGEDDTSDDPAVADRIAADGTAADATDVEVVPSFALFRDEEFVTVVSGNQPYEVFEGALGL